MLDTETLHMALIGYRAERLKLTEKIAELEHRLDGRKVIASAGAAPTRTRRKMTAAAIAHIRAGQKKRWAEFHAKQHKAVKPATKKRKPVSLEVMKKRIEGLKKARAARAAKRTQKAA